MMEQYDNRGMPYADNETNFKQNLIRTSKTELLGMLEELRHKEMTDSFITDDEAEYCIRTLEVAQNNIEIHYEIISKYIDYIILLNKDRKKNNLRLISISKEFDKYDRAVLKPTIQRDVSRVKNICQIAKSRNGIAVKTLTTQQVVTLARNELSSIPEQKKPSIWDIGKKKPENNQVTTIGGNDRGY